MTCGLVWDVAWAWLVAWCEDGMGIACGLVYDVVWSWPVARGVSHGVRQCEALWRNGGESVRHGVGRGVDMTCHSV